MTWKAQEGIAYYNVQVYRNGKRILVGWPSQASFQLPGVPARAGHLHLVRVAGVQACERRHHVRRPDRPRDVRVREVGCLPADRLGADDDRGRLLASKPIADVAQLVEHQLPKLRVASSSLVVRFNQDSGCGCRIARAVEGFFLNAVRPTAEESWRNLSSTPHGVRCKHSDRLILEETQHGPIHGRLPVRQRPDCGVGTSIPGRPLSLSRLPQASWGAFHASAVFPQDAVTIDGETRDYAGRFFCPRCGSSVFARTADEIEVNLGSLDAPDQLMPTYESWIVRRESWLPPFPLTRRYERDRDATGRFEE